MSTSTRLFGFVLLTLFSHEAYSQLRVYKGPAVWFPQEGAIEEFRYQANDSLQAPQGAYSWMHETKPDKNGTQGLFVMQANYRNGELQGDFEVVYYHIRFSIDNYNMQTINPKTQGDRYYLKGRMEKGKAGGTWRFEMNQYNEAEETREVLQFNTSTKNWLFKSGGKEFRGTTNDQGYFDGTWNWGGTTTENLRTWYQDGVLIRMSVAGQDVFVDELAASKKLLASNTPRVPYKPEPHWIWENGNQLRDSLHYTQKPVEEYMQQGTLAYKNIKDVLGAHPHLKFPKLNGTQRFYFALDSARQQHVAKLAEEMLRMDSVLLRKLNQPVFELRRKSNPTVDSLLIAGEQLHDQITEHRQTVTQFMNEESRYVPARFLSIGNKTVLTTQDEYIKALADEKINLSGQWDSLMERLEAKTETLRQLGAVEELEEEWFYLNEEIRTKYAPESTDSWEEILFQRLVVNGFEENKQYYATLNNLEQQKNYLLKEIGTTTYLRDFYAEKTYQTLNDVDEFFMKQYTKFLYNPYMGVNNVEMVVKKKFIQKILTQFWPYKINSMAAVITSEEFVTKTEELKLYKQLIVQLADQNGVSVKRLERRVRNAKDMPEIEELLQQYLKDHSQEFPGNDSARR